jgi:hypothetical protein
MELDKLLIKFHANTKIYISEHNTVVFQGTIREFMKNDTLGNKYGDREIYTASINISNSGVMQIDLR